MDLHTTDPEFAERFEYFAFNEVVNEENQQLQPAARYLAILAALIGCGGTEAYKETLPRALQNGITPITAKEIVYQAADYLGYGRMLPFLNITNEVLTEAGVKLPLDGQATTTLDNRLQKGIEAQAEIFGEHMKEAWKSGHINRWLAGELLRGLLYPKRAQPGGTRAHHLLFSYGAGRLRTAAYRSRKRKYEYGNDKEFLIKVVSQCLPYIGYPRSLNAIACINKAVEQ